MCNYRKVYATNTSNEVTDSNLNWTDNNYYNYLRYYGLSVAE